MKTLIVLISIAVIVTGCSRTGNSISIPVIYSTDLYNPPMDPDDNFDLACLFAIKEFDIRAIIIDNAAKTTVTPGIVPIKQIEYITQKKVPYAVGLKGDLKSMNDDGKDQFESQQGVRLILSTLGESEKPVTVITVGSLRDVAAALNADPDLCRAKIDRIFVFAGDASVKDPSVFREYNVGLDTLAFARVMNSGLNIFWVPCFDGGAFVNNGRASYILALREKLFASVSPRLMNYFRYCLLAKKDSLYLDFLNVPQDTMEIKTITYEQEDGRRNLWCSQVFPYIANRQYILDGNDCLTLTNGNKVPGGTIIKPFIFMEENLYSDKSGMVRPDTSGTGRNMIRVFEVTDMKAFTPLMTSVVSHLLNELDR